LYCFYVLQVLEENPSNSKIIKKSANSLLERFNSKLILNLTKQKSEKSVIFGINPNRVCHYILIITFRSSIRIGGIGKLIKNIINNSKIGFS